MKCNEIRELLSPYIDKMLDELEMREVEEHLSACSGCRNEYNEIKEMVDLLGQAAMVPVPDAFRFRLKKGLNEEKQNMIKGGVIEKNSRKNRWRIITSVAAVFAVGVVSFGLYNDILGVLPDKMNGQTQTGAAREESAAPGAGEADVYSYDDGAKNDMAADGIVEAQIEDLQEEAERMKDVTRIMLGASVDEPKAVAPPDQARSPEAGGAGVSGRAGEGVLGQDVENIDDGVAYGKEESRSTSAGVEREMTSEEYYTSLLEEKLKDFDYQILSTESAEDEEWLFRVFIFYGKDGNTYNEEITIIGKDGRLEAVNSGEWMGL